MFQICHLNEDCQFYVARTKLKLFLVSTNVTNPELKFVTIELLPFKMEQNEFPNGFRREENEKVTWSVSEERV